MVSRHDNHEHGLLQLAQQDDLAYFREHHLFRHIPMEAKQAAAIRKAGATATPAEGAAAATGAESEGASVASESDSEGGEETERTEAAAAASSSSSSSTAAAAAAVEEEEETHRHASHKTPAKFQRKRSNSATSEGRPSNSAASGGGGDEGGGTPRTPAPTRATLERLNALFSSDPRLKFVEGKGVGGQATATKFLFNGVPWNEAPTPTLPEITKLLEAKQATVPTPDKDRIAGILRRLKARAAKAGVGGVASND